MLFKLGKIKTSVFGRRYSSEISTSSIAIWPVILVRNDNLPSILGVERPFIPFSRIKPCNFSHKNLRRLLITITKIKIEFHKKNLDLVVMTITSCPNDHDIGNWWITDPRFRPRNFVNFIIFIPFRLRLHASILKIKFLKYSYFDYRIAISD